ncbi:prostatic acid phosphatase-like isoform X3 [Pogonomyrmex barbatus]|uniref:acid phosphatase n=1 Tax=Pogonomyrmex barbatus TaxID=144034 RepID=A0A8N1S936_9HYME|nr:prostatic acid phosphatase-like isoform X3 [Pogonomyrmex barbatus]
MNRMLPQTFLLLLNLFVSIGQSELRLELVQVIMRHGERTPLFKELYPKDPYNVSIYEPWGLSQLTNQGKLTEYRIGIMLRQRYDNFLGSIYYSRDIYAVSTDYDRTKMSLQLMLAGLYPPDTSQLWNPNLPWLAIPTHYVPKRKIMNLTLPEWCTDDVYSQIQSMVELEYEIFSYTTQLKRLNGGMLIKKFIDNINGSNKGLNPRKMYVYSAHDMNIAAFAKAQNISEPKIPDYGSTFLFEKLRDNTGKVFIRIFLWTGTTEKLMSIKLTDCDEICPLETYLELMRDVIPSDEETTCLWDNLTREEQLALFNEELRVI